jgi:uncharacterized protein YdbL (DUF1318 family)
MKTNWLNAVLFALLVGLSGSAAAQANLKIDTPAVTALRGSLRDHHQQLAPYYETGAVGLTREGTVAIRDANLVPLAQRANVNAQISGTNQDRGELYREIARANAHPEWEGDIRTTFAQRWIERAKPGWYYQDANGNWVQKK